MEQSGVKPQKKMSTSCAVIVLRLLALGGTVTATLVMALNKETKTFRVATIGTSSITATFQAKFQNTPAFVFFVITNAVGSLHNLLMLMVELFGHKFGFKDLQLLVVTLLDMATVALLSAGSGGAASMAELGKNGNSHARWDKICDRFGAYCDRGGVALIAAFFGIVFLLVINGLSITALFRRITKPSVASA